jgi:hypothetical protein
VGVLLGSVHEKLEVSLDDNRLKSTRVQETMPAFSLPQKTFEGEAEEVVAATVVEEKQPMAIVALPETDQNENAVASTTTCQLSTTERLNVASVLVARVAEAAASNPDSFASLTDFVDVQHTQDLLKYTTITS